MVYVIIYIGRSGCLLLEWDPEKLNLVPSFFGRGILLTGSFFEGNRQITFLNCYRPCLEQKILGDKVVSSGMLAYKNLIVVGDLKFMIIIEEIWGGTARLDPLVGYFKDLFQRIGSVDIVPNVVVSTWRNFRSGRDEIAKILDRVIFS
jgi:hypothetical protein